MEPFIKKYHDACIKYRTLIQSNSFSHIFNQQEVESIFKNYNTLENFILTALKTDDFEKKNSIMLSLCKGCKYYNNCTSNDSLSCRDHIPYVDFQDIEFMGHQKVVKWFYLNTLLYLNEQQDKSKIFAAFYILFKKIKKIKLINKVVIMYSDSFGFYERVKNSNFLSYQGNIIEQFLSQMMYFINGEYCEFYFDNITNEAESKSFIEDKMYKSLNNHQYLRKKYKYTIERQHIIKDNFGNVLFTLDMLLKVEDKFLLCVECDGYTYHSNPERFDLDRLRDRTLLKQGIYTARFSSQDINYRIEDSLRDIVDIIEFHLHAISFR